MNYGLFSQQFIEMQRQWEKTAIFLNNNLCRHSSSIQRMLSKHFPFSKYYFEILASNLHSPINDNVQVVEGVIQILFDSEELHFSQEKECFNKRLIKVREERVASP